MSKSQHEAQDGTDEGHEPNDRHDHDEDLENDAADDDNEDEQPAPLTTAEKFDVPPETAKEIDGDEEAEHDALAEAAWLRTSD